MAATPSPRRLVVVADRGRSLVPPDQTVFDRDPVELVGVGRGEELLDLIRERRPALLIVGPDLPDLTLRSICLRIRKDPTLQRVAILLVVSPAEHARVAELLAAGINDVIYRPISSLEFDRKVRRMLRVPPRAVLHVLVQIRTATSADGFLTLGRSQNLSASGMLLATDRQLELGAELVLRFPLAPGSLELEVKAEVARRERSAFGHTYGVRFLDLPAGAQEAIDSLVAIRRAHTDEA